MKTPNALRPLLVAVLSSWLAAGCAEDYRPRVICHNSNCVEPANPEEDDTVEALQASLALMGEGRPVIDGMEIDTFWFGEEARCLFAHDLKAPERAVEAMVAVDILNAFLTGRQAQGLPLTRQAEVFSVFIELKPHVTRSKADLHSPEQLQQHAACALALGQSLAASAEQAGHGLEIVYSSFAPSLLRALRDNPLLAVLEAGPARVRLSILQGIPRPLDTQTRPLDLFPHDIGIDLIGVHPHWTRPQDRQAYASRGLELGYWMFSIVPETLDAIRAHRPTYITTSEARALTAWLERR
jgi:hypothetical protein